MSGLRGSKHLKIQLKEIELATKNFETCIGKGGYGLVYKGELCITGKLTTVAVKRLNEHLGQGLKEFLTEIHLLTGQKHPNLISLLGYCDEGKEKIIVYEYAERGSLDKYLTSSNTNYTLTWLERLKICVDAARGLDHLHNHVGKHQTIIHRDIKSANILVDQNWVAKISDLGLSKLSFAGLDRSAVISHACGTPGYCEPEYIDTGIVKKESDVYSFGMVLFEVLCGRLCSFRHHDGLLLSARLAKDYYEKTKLDEIIDPGLREQMNFESKNKFSTIAYRCVQDDRQRRPGMDLVVKELVESLEIQARYEGKPHHYYGPVASDLKAAGKRTMEWDLNGWKRDRDLFAATALGKSLQLFPELQTNPVMSDSSSPSSVEINLQNDKGKRELENRRRVMVLEEEEGCDESGALNLKLGLQLYPITEDEAETWEGKSGKKSKVAGATSNRAVCQVDDCRTDLRNAKDYHRRHKVCELHSRATKALVLKEMQRFCQQCSRFHILAEFNEGKRSCRRRLAGHKYISRK